MNAAGGNGSLAVRGQSGKAYLPALRASPAALKTDEHRAQDLPARARLYHRPGRNPERGVHLPPIR